MGDTASDSQIESDSRPCQFLGADGGASRGADPGTPSAFIQWKGTDVCLDLYCPCGRRGHFDGDFAYSLKCVGCGRVFLMPSMVPLVEVGPEAFHYERAKSLDYSEL